MKLFVGDLIPVNNSGIDRVFRKCRGKFLVNIKKDTF